MDDRCLSKKKEKTHTTCVFTGKSGSVGGSKGRVVATYGIVECIKHWADRNNCNLCGKTYIIQGFGNVGSNTAILLSKLGMICVGVSDYSRALVSEEGFNVFKLQKHCLENKSLEGYNYGEEIEKSDFFFFRM